MNQGPPMIDLKTSMIKKAIKWIKLRGDGQLRGDQIGTRRGEEGVHRIRGRQQLTCGREGVKNDYGRKVKNVHSQRSSQGVGKKTLKKGIF